MISDKIIILQKGEKPILVFQTPSVLSKNESEILSEKYEKITNCKVLIVDGGASLEAIIINRENNSGGS